MTDEEPDELEKIARLAAKRGYLSERSAGDIAAQARLHHAGPRAFLRKLLEIKAGLTYDEIARLEKEALAPPPPPPPGKPLPKPFDGKPPSGTAPALDSPALQTPSRALPRPFAKAPEKADAGATPESGTMIGKKKLPSLGGKKDVPPPPPPVEPEKP